MERVKLETALCNGYAALHLVLEEIQAGRDNFLPLQPLVETIKDLIDVIDQQHIALTMVLKSQPKSDVELKEDVP